MSPTVPFSTVLVLALPFLAGCEGALGGNIGRARSTHTGATAATDRSGSSGPRRVRAERPAPRAQVAEPGLTPGPTTGATTGATTDPIRGAAPTTGSGAPTTEAAAQATPALPRTSSTGGGRGRRGGGSRRGGAALVRVTRAGDAPAGSAGTLTGSVAFEGQVPKRSPLPLIATTKGCAKHSQTPYTEDLLVENGRLANVVVAIRKVPAGVSVPAAPTDPFVLDQVGCMYVPHVSAVQSGRPVHARNSDALSHNVHVIATLNEDPNRTVAEGGAPVQLALDLAEAVKFVCDIHPWMSAHIVVVDHPWFAVSAADGSWTITGLPPGEYELEAWHERLKKIRSERFEVGPGGEVNVEFTYRQ